MGNFASATDSSTFANLQVLVPCSDTRTLFNHTPTGSFGHFRWQMALLERRPLCPSGSVMFSLGASFQSIRFAMETCGITTMSNWINIIKKHSYKLLPHVLPRHAPQAGMNSAMPWMLFGLRVTPSSSAGLANDTFCRLVAWPAAGSAITLTLDAFAARM